MIFQETKIPGAFLILPEALEDERGLFARTWCHLDFESRGLNPGLVQCSTSFNTHAHTLRGLHYQCAPHLEAKLVRCTRGAVFDVMADLRKDSPAFGQWIGEELSADNRKMFYIPEGLAHGFQTLEDKTEILYQISTYFAPQSAAGLRWDDPDLAIEWPLARDRIISDRDRKLPLLRESDPLSVQSAA